MQRHIPLLSALLILVACAGQPEVTPQARKARAEIGALKIKVSTLESRATVLKRENTALERNRATLETRLGLRTFRANRLKEGRRNWRFAPDKATLIERYGIPGRPVLLNEYTAKFDAYVVAVWATWCKPCTSREELSQLDTLRKGLESSGSMLMGVAIDDLAKVLNHRRAPKWHYPVWHRQDANIEWLPKGFIKQAGLSLPLFLVVSGNGQVLYWHNAPLSDAIREELLSATLSHRVRQVLPASPDDRRRRSKQRRSKRRRR